MSAAGSFETQPEKNACSHKCCDEPQGRQAKIKQSIKRATLLQKTQATVPEELLEDSRIESDLWFRHCPPGGKRQSWEGKAASRVNRCPLLAFSDNAFLSLESDADQVA